VTSVRQGHGAPSGLCLLCSEAVCVDTQAPGVPRRRGGCGGASRRGPERGTGSALRPSLARRPGEQRARRSVPARPVAVLALLVPPVNLRRRSSARQQGVSALCRTARQPPRHAGAHSASQTQAVPLRIAAWPVAARAASQRRSSCVRSGGNAPTRWGRWSGRRRHTSGTPGPRRPSPWRTWRAARRSARQRRVPASRLSPTLGFAAAWVGRALVELIVARVAVLGLVHRREARVERRRLHLRRRETESERNGVACQLRAAPRLDVALLLLRLLRRGSGVRRQQLAAQTTGRRAQARLRSSVLGLALPGRCTHRLRLRLRRRSLLLSRGRLLGRHLLLRLLALSAAQQPPHGDVPAPAERTTRQQRGAAASCGTRSTRRSARTASCPDGALIVPVEASILLLAARAGACWQRRAAGHAPSTTGRALFTRERAEKRPDGVRGTARRREVPLRAAVHLKSREAAWARSAWNGMRRGRRAAARQGSTVRKKLRASRKQHVRNTHAPRMPLRSCSMTMLMMCGVELRCTATPLPLRAAREHASAPPAPARTCSRCSRARTWRRRGPPSPAHRAPRCRRGARLRPRGARAGPRATTPRREHRGRGGAATWRAPPRQQRTAARRRPAAESLRAPRAARARGQPRPPLAAQARLRRAPTRRAPPPPACRHRPRPCTRRAARARRWRPQQLRARCVRQLRAPHARTPAALPRTA